MTCHRRLLHLLLDGLHLSELPHRLFQDECKWTSKPRQHEFLGNAKDELNVPRYSEVAHVHLKLLLVSCDLSCWTCEKAQGEKPCPCEPSLFATGFPLRPELGMLNPKPLTQAQTLPNEAQAANIH